MANARSLEGHQLVETVQHNCHISDALHARNYSLCIIQGDGGKALRETAKRGADHWQGQTQRVLDIYKAQEGDEGKALMQALAVLDAGIRF